jgi:hypothetical protein
LIQELPNDFNHDDGGIRAAKPKLAGKQQIRLDKMTAKAVCTRKPMPLLNSLCAAAEPNTSLAWLS